MQLFLIFPQQNNFARRLGEHDGATMFLVPEKQPKAFL